MQLKQNHIIGFKIDKDQKIKLKQLVTQRGFKQVSDYLRFKAFQDDEFKIETKLVIIEKRINEILNFILKS